MNHISLLIVDDDLNKISSIIKTIKEAFTDTLIIHQASCVQEAIENLQKKEFHLLITDLQMPLKFDDEPNNDGGKALIKELYKKKNTANVPMYIIGLTQFENLKSTFKGAWKVWFYDSAAEDWKIDLRDLIYHISLIKSRIKSEKIETVFVEGPTDKKIIEACLKNFFKEYSELIFIDTISYGGGTSWVERQLFIWAKSLSTKVDKKTYIKAIGLFDNDGAGNRSIDNLRKNIELDSAESKTFSILKASYKYSPILKSIKSKGITFPTTIEDLITPKYWLLASEKGWLVKRELKNIKLDEQILDLAQNEINEVNLKNIGFTDNEILLILNKITDEFKMNFSNLIFENVPESVEYIKYLVDDIIKKAKLQIDVAETVQ